MSCNLIIVIFVNVIVRRRYKINFSHKLVCVMQYLCLHNAMLSHESLQVMERKDY
jgi:hypothetical protein